MQEIDIGEIKEGVRISMHIRFDEYFIVLSKYNIPTTQDIERITRFSLSPLYEEGETKPFPEEETVKESMYEPEINTMQGQAATTEEKRDIYEVLITYITELLSACKNRTVSLGRIRKVASLAAGFALRKTEDALLPVARGRKTNRLSAHVLNTGILTAILVSSENIEGRQLIDAVCGAIMHDIGLMLFDVDEPIIAIEMHTVRGGRYLKSIEGCPSTIFMPAFQHHEKADGSGYPDGLTLSDTSSVSRIVSICDSCDSHTSYIRLGENLSLHLKKEDLFIWKKTDFDVRLFDVMSGVLHRTFMEGRRVLLNDKRMGVIAKTTPRFPVSPVINPVPGSEPAAPVELLKTSDIWIERFL